MANVLIVHESPSVRSDLARALEAEGFRVGEVDSSASAVREIWAGTYDAAVISPQLPKVSGAPLEEHLRHLAPEIVTVAIGREPPVRIARKVAELLEGGAAAA